MALGREGVSRAWMPPWSSEGDGRQYAPAASCRLMRGEPGAHGGVLNSGILRFIRVGPGEVTKIVVFHGWGDLPTLPDPEQSDESHAEKG